MLLAIAILPEIGWSQLATTNVWLGIDTNWNNTADWSEGTLPSPTDVVVFQGNFGVSTTNNAFINANQLLSGIVFNGGGWYAGQPQGSTGYKLYTDTNGITVAASGVTDEVYQCYLNNNQTWLVASNSAFQTKSVGNASFTYYFGDSGTNTGTLILASSSATSDANLQVNGGTVILNRTGSKPSMSNLTITNGSVIVEAPGQFAYNKTLTISGPNALLSNGNRSNILENLEFYAGTIQGGGYLIGSNAAPLSTIQGNLTLGTNGDPLLAFEFFSTNGNGFDFYGGTRTLTVNSGVIISNSLWDSQAVPGTGLIKAGPGDLVLQSPWSYSGQTEVSGGLLAIDSLSGTNDIVVNSGSTIGGIGTIIAPLTVNPGGVLSPGDPITTNNIFGTLTIDNTAVLAGTTLFNVASNTVLMNSALAGDTLTLGGALVVTNIGTNSLAVGNSFQILNFGTLNGSFSSMTLPEGYTWDTSALDTTGIITVTSVETLPNTPTNISYYVSNSNFTVSWPSSYTGWILQEQTNALSESSTNWMTVTGSAVTNSMSFSINATNPMAFFRLVYP